MTTDQGAAVEAVEALIDALEVLIDAATVEAGDAEERSWFPPGKLCWTAEQIARLEKCSQCEVRLAALHRALRASTDIRAILDSEEVRP